MARHADFEKIHSAFLKHYSKDPEFGECRYAEWVKLSGLDETQSYYAQAAARAGKCKQSFEWANFLLQFVKEDQDAKYYKVEALFPVESMNGEPFTREEVLQAARTLTGKPSNLNHDPNRQLKEIEIVAAQFEDDCVECLVRIEKNSPVIDMIERNEIVNVSIEGDWSHGVPGRGLVLTGLGWLTKETTLPGIPLTRIMPIEKIVESFDATKLTQQVLLKGAVKEKIKEQGEVSCVLCTSSADFLVSVCQACFDRFPAGASASQSTPGETERLEEKDLEAIAEKVASKLTSKDSAEVEKLKSEVAEAKVKLSETEGKLSEANRVVEDLRKQLPGGGLVKDPPKMMPVSEAISLIRDVLPAPAIQRVWGLGPQRLCQDLRRIIQLLEAKAGA